MTGKVIPMVVPEPYFRLVPPNFQCIGYGGDRCLRHFWFRKNYVRHYIDAHVPRWLR